jgi:hypothetical protein
LRPISARSPADAFPATAAASVSPEA